MPPKPKPKLTIRGMLGLSPPDPPSFVPLTSPEPHLSPSSDAPKPLGPTPTLRDVADMSVRAQGNTGPQTKKIYDADGDEEPNPFVSLPPQVPSIGLHSTSIDPDVWALGQGINANKYDEIGRNDIVSSTLYPPTILQREQWPTLDDDALDKMQSAAEMSKAGMPVGDDDVITHGAYKGNHSTPEFANATMKGFDGKGGWLEKLRSKYRRKFDGRIGRMYAGQVYKWQLDCMHANPFKTQETCLDDAVGLSNENRSKFYAHARNIEGIVRDYNSHRTPEERQELESNPGFSLPPPHLPGLPEEQQLSTLIRNGSNKFDAFGSRMSNATRAMEQRAEKLLMTSFTPGEETQTLRQQVNEGLGRMVSAQTRDKSIAARTALGDIITLAEKTPGFELKTPLKHGASKFPSQQALRMKTLKQTKVDIGAANSSGDFDHAQALKAAIRSLEKSKITPAELEMMRVVTAAASNAGGGARTRSIKSIRRRRRHSRGRARAITKRKNKQ